MYKLRGSLPGNYVWPFTYKQLQEQCVRELAKLGTYMDYDSDQEQTMLLLLEDFTVCNNINCTYVPTYEVTKSPVIFFAEEYVLDFCKQIMKHNELCTYFCRIN